MVLATLKNEAVHYLKIVLYNISPKGIASTPHLLKREIIKSYATQYGLTTLVETGTYRGDMIFGVQNFFDEIHSIELGENLYKAAKKRFSAKSHIHLHQGDSKDMLSKLVSILDTPCLFWLDAHYSGGITAIGSQETPILDELQTLFERFHNKHVILIDDARCFNGTNSYPTPENLVELIQQFRPGWSLQIQQDIIRITPP